MRSQDEQLHELIAEQAAEWHVVCSEGELSQQQARAFMRWLRTSPVHIAEYLTLAEVAKDVFDAARHDPTPVRELLARSDPDGPVQLHSTGVRGLHQGVRVEPLSPREYFRARMSYQDRAKSVRRRDGFRWMVAVATVLAACVVGLVGLDLYQRAAPGTVGETIATQHGELRSVWLSDGTFLQLDSDSVVTVRFDRSSRTVVVDRGQAYFKVVKDSGRPFRVRVGNALVRDVGTAFDVYRRPSRTTVTVAEGQVQVWSPPSAAPPRDWVSSLTAFRQPRGQPVADLDAGQQATLTATGQLIRLSAVDVQRSLAWRHGRITFQDQPISLVAAEFNRYNGLQVDVKDPTVGALRITGTFSAHDVPTFVAFMSSLPHVRAQRHGQTVVVTSQRP